MRPPNCLLFPAVIFCFSVLVQAQSDMNSAQTFVNANVFRKLRYDPACDTENLVKTYMKHHGFHGRDKVHLTPIVLALMNILRETLPYSAHPTDGKLTQLADQLANAADALLKVVSDNGLSRASELIYNVSNNSTALTTRQLVELDQPQSPSNFANAVKRVAGNESDVRSISNLAILARCFFDGMKAPNDTITYDFEHADSARAVVSRVFWHCRKKLNVQRFHSTDEMIVIDWSQFFKSNSNSKDVVTGFAHIMEVLKKPESYENFEAFAGNFEGSRRLKAILQIYNETKRCLMTLYKGGMKCIAKKLGYFPFVAKEILTREDEPATDYFRNLSDATVIAEPIELILDFLIVVELSENPPAERIVNFLMPESDLKKLNKRMLISEDLNENLKFASEVGKTNKMIEALLVLFYDHLHGLGNRLGMTNGARRFFLKVVDKLINRYLAEDGTMEEGMTAREAVLEDLRQSFLQLSAADKKALAYSLPFRTTAILSFLF